MSEWWGEEMRGRRGESGGEGGARGIVPGRGGAKEGAKGESVEEFPSQRVAKCLRFPSGKQSGEDSVGC